MHFAIFARLSGVAYRVHNPDFESLKDLLEILRASYNQSATRVVLRVNVR